MSLLFFLRRLNALISVRLRFVPTFSENERAKCSYFKKRCERTANGSCRKETARPKGTVVSIFGMQR